MAARIRSLRNFILPIDEASRDDLVSTDVVSLLSIDAASTYAWSLIFVPEGSTATFSGSSTSISPGSFTVDLPGPYLVRLTIDAALPTESTQHVRLRALTPTFGLRLVAAGERRDGTGIIPVDVDPVGWAYNQNFNLLTLEAAISASATTLAQTLVLGNSTGGNDIVVSTGDTVRAPDATLPNTAGDLLHLASGQGLGTGDGGDVVLDPGTSAGSGKRGRALVDGALAFIQREIPKTAVNEGALFVSNGSGGLTANKPYYRFASNGVVTPLLQDLSTTLGYGNSTGSHDIIMTSGDVVIGESGAGLAGPVVLRGGTATSGGATNGGNVRLRPGAGFGGGSNGYLHLQNAAATQGVRISVSAADTFKIDSNAGGGLPLLYNAATGKLDVPGLIDPTGVVFEQAAAPTTSATEGAIFFSDGSGGLILNHFYFRGPLNDTPIDISGASQTLTQTLVLGNVTGGTSVVVSDGDIISGVNEAPASGNPGHNLSIRAGLGDPAIQVDGNLILAQDVFFGSIQWTADGNARGFRSVDWQSYSAESDPTHVASGPGSAILWGQTNKASGVRAGAGGDKCFAEGDYSLALGGQNSTAKSINGVVLGGSNCLVDTLADYGSARGIGGLARNFGEHVVGLSDIEGGLTHVRTEALWSATSSNATPKEIFLDGDGGSRQYLLAAGSSLTFDILVNVYRGNTAAAGWRLSGVVRRTGLVGSTAIVGTTTLTSLGVDASLAAATITATADTTTGALKLTVTGVAASLSWTAAMTGVYFQSS